MAKKDVYYVIILVQDENQSIYDIKTAIESFIENQFEDKKFVSAIIMNSNPLLVIRQFKDFNKALEFFNPLEKLLNSNQNGFKILPISKIGYRELLNTQKLDIFNSDRTIGS